MNIIARGTRLPIRDLKSVVLQVPIETVNSKLANRDHFEARHLTHAMRLSWLQHSEVLVQLSLRVINEFDSALTFTRVR